MRRRVAESFVMRAGSWSSAVAELGGLLLGSSRDSGDAGPVSFFFSGRTFTNRALALCSRIYS